MRIRYVIWILYSILAVVLAVISDDRLTRVLWIISAVLAIALIFIDRRFPKKDKTSPERSTR